MKRLFILASAAIVALASCTKTEVVYNEAPQEIGFKAVTGVMTKAVQTATTFTQDMGVIAYQSGTSSVYFANADFNKATTTWECDDAKYWPIDSALDFFVYSPYQETGVTPDAAAKTLSVLVPNNATVQDDYLYSNTYITSKTKDDVEIPVDFDHALAYVTVKFIGTDAVTLSDAKLNGTYQSGTYTVTYGTPTSIAWSAQADETNLALASGELSSDYSTSWLVVPEDDNDATNTITFTYTTEGMTGTAIPQTIDLNEAWEAGKHYIYNVSITSSEIKFTVDTVTGWNGDIDNDGDVDADDQSSTTI